MEKREKKLEKNISFSLGEVVRAILSDRFFLIVLLALLVIIGAIIYIKQEGIDYSINPSKIVTQTVNTVIQKEDLSKKTEAEFDEDFLRLQTDINEGNSDNIISVKFNDEWLATSTRELFSESQINLSSLEACNKKVYKNDGINDDCKVDGFAPSFHNNSGYYTTCPCRVDFFQVGEVLSGKYKDWEIYCLVIKERDIDGSYSIYRFLKNGKDTIFLSKYSDHVSVVQRELFNFNKFFLQDPKIIISDFEIPSVVRYPQYNFSLLHTLSNPRPRLRISEDEFRSLGSRPMEIENNGTSFFFWPYRYYQDLYYYVIMPDGTTSRYRVY